MNPKSMQPISARTGFLVLALVAIASLGGVLTACSNTSQSDYTTSFDQNQAQNTPATEAGGKQDTMHGGSMNHGSGMNHSMASPVCIPYEHLNSEHCVSCNGNQSHLPICLWRNVEVQLLLPDSAKSWPVWLNCHLYPFQFTLICSDMLVGTSWLMRGTIRDRSNTIWGTRIFNIIPCVIPHVWRELGDGTGWCAATNVCWGCS